MCLEEIPTPPGAPPVFLPERGEDLRGFPKSPVGTPQSIIRPYYYTAKVRWFRARPKKGAAPDWRVKSLFCNGRALLYTIGFLRGRHLPARPQGHQSLNSPCSAPVGRGQQRGLGKASCAPGLHAWEGFGSMPLRRRSPGVAASSPLASYYARSCGGASCGMAEHGSG